MEPWEGWEPAEASGISLFPQFQAEGNPERLAPWPSPEAKPCHGSQLGISLLTDFVVALEAMNSFRRQSRIRREGSCRFVVLDIRIDIPKRNT